MFWVAAPLMVELSMTTMLPGCDHGEVGLGGDDHSESLEIGERFDVRIAVVIEREFAEIDGASFRRDGPENVGQDIRVRIWWRLRGR